MELDDIGKSLWHGSDFHFERYADNYKKIRSFADIPERGVFSHAALAGDICHSHHVGGVMSAIKDRMQCPIYYTPGNHEFYDGFRRKVTMSQQVEIMREGCAKLDQVYFLYNEGRDIPGTNCSIFGSPWFTDFGWHRNQLEVHDIVRYIADYGNTLVDFEGGSRNLEAEDHIEFHQEAVAALEKWARETVKRKRQMIIMTHWAPSVACAHGHFPAEGLIAAYFSTDYLDRNHDIFPPGTRWIHGHTHWNTAFNLGNVEVSSNQFGYSGESACNLTYQPLKYLRM